MNTNEVKYALGSTVNDGLLCVDGHDSKVTTEFDEGERYEGLVKLFDSFSDAMDYVVEHEYWALTPVVFNHTN